MNPLSTISLFWILLITAFIFYKLKWNKTWKTLTFLAFFQLFIFTVPPLSTFMIRNLEQQYPPLDPAIAKRNLPVLVLGGGHTNDPTLPPIHRLSVQAGARVAEGVRIYNMSGGNTMIFSGFSRSNKTPHATVMAETALSLGVAEKDTLMMVDPSTTWLEAEAYKKRFGTNGEFILVTSAAHIPRAMEIFKRMGLKPIAAPANYLIKHDPDNSLYTWWPSTYKAMNAEIAMHEYVGQWYYRYFKDVE